MKLNSKLYLSLLAIVVLPLGRAQTNTFPSSGNVGVGTVSPSAQLEVVGRSHFGTGTDNVANTTNGLSVQDSAGNSVAVAVGKSTGRSVGLSWLDNSGSNGAAYLYTFSNAAPLGISGSTVNLATGTQSSSLYITTPGNVGIGLTGPLGGLHVGRSILSAGNTVAEYARFGAINATGISADNDRETRVTIRGSGTNSEGRATLRFEHLSIQELVAKLSLSGANNSDIPTAAGGLSDALQLFTETSSALQLGTANAARLTLAASGNVGVGVSNPSAPLTVKTFDQDTLAIYGPINNSAALQTLLDGQTLGSYPYGGDENRLLLQPLAGRVGIGMTNPTATLTVTSGDDARIKLYSNAGSVAVIDAVANTNDATGRWLSLNPTGANVGIGTTAPTHKLTVNGTIRAKEVIVDTGWSDYVFASDYRLAPLGEVEQHIRENKHLPGIPSAQEVAEKGISIGDMQAKLLAKIEELTLHQIAQEKELQSLRAEIKASRSTP